MEEQDYRESIKEAQERYKEKEANKTFLDELDEEIADWEMVRKEYHLLQQQSATQVEYHALAGGRALIKDFIGTLKGIRRSYKKKKKKQATEED